MATATTGTLAALYLEDETAWLDEMANVVIRRDLAALDLDNLGEFLRDMALRERREVRSRLVVLLTHVLKWEHQPKQRSRSWRTTILHQRQELNQHAGRGVLRAHAEAALSGAYDDAVELAASETGLLKESFPADCPYTFEQLLAVDLSAVEG